MRKFLVMAVAVMMLAACESSTNLTDPPADFELGRFSPDSPVFVVSATGIWADFVIASEQGLRYDGTCVTAIRSNPLSALGEPDFDDTENGNWFSLGMPTTFTDACGSADSKHGSITVGFGSPGDPLWVGGDLVMVAEATYDRAGYPTESVFVEGRNEGTWYDLGTADNHAGDGVFDLPISGDMCYDAIRVTNTTTMGDYEAGLGDVLAYVGSRDGLMPDGFDVDAIGASAICERDEGCTYTQGYWKNHEEDWPEGYLPGDLFYNSGLTWAKVFDEPVKGRPYFNLAHQFMAATLNDANSASVPSEVSDALDAAAAYFGDPETEPNDKDPDNKDDILGWKDTLDAYNNGFIGPGHCDD